MRKVILFALLLAAARASAQVEPAATGSAGPPVSGNLEYSARYSQVAILYGDSQGGNEVNSTVSASLAYTHPSVRRPFAIAYGGGYMRSITGPSLGTGIFQHLTLSQGFVQRRWSVEVSDGVSYTPQAPLVGFSGQPGTGEPVGGSGATPAGGQTILTLDTRVLNNSTGLNFTYALDNGTTLRLGGGFELMRYPDGNGLDSDGEDADGEISRRLNARNSLAGRYSYSHFRYNAGPYSGELAGSFAATAVTASYRRLWSRRLTTELAAGPQWTTGSENALVPPVQTVTVSASLNYQLRKEWASLSYYRGINGGAGYLPGATVDTVEGNFSRPFHRTLLLSLVGAYLHTTALQHGGGSTDARFGGIEAAQGLGPYFSVFGSYTAIDQTSDLSGSTPQNNLLHHPYQVVSFGIAFSPREVRLRH